MGVSSARKRKHRMDLIGEKQDNLQKGCDYTKLKPKIPKGQTRLK